MGDRFGDIPKMSFELYPRTMLSFKQIGRCLVIMERSALLKWYLWSACGTTSVHHYGRVARGGGSALDASAYGVALFNHAAERLDLDLGWETLRICLLNMGPDSMHRKYNVETSPAAPI